MTYTETLTALRAQRKQIDVAIAALEALTGRPAAAPTQRLPRARRHTGLPPSATARVAGRAIPVTETQTPDTVS